MENSLSETAVLLSKIKDEFWLSESPKAPEGWERFTDDTKSKNYWEGIEETQQFWGKDWSSLSLEDFARCRHVFTSLPKEHVPYFVGGYMTISLKGNLSDNIFTELLAVFDPRGQGRKAAKRTWAFNRTKIAPFNERQRIVLVDYLRFLESNELDEDTAFFQALLSGEICEQ